MLVLTGIMAVILVSLLVSFTPKATPGIGDIATIRIYESADDFTSKIIISYDNFQHEEIDLWGYRQKYVDEWFDNLDTIAATMNRFKRKGYDIISSSSAGDISSFNDQQLTTYILEKKK